MGHDKLVPITREVLRDFYADHPMAPVPVEEYDTHLAAIEKLVEDVGKSGSSVPETVGMETPTRIDDCFWRNRMFCEELAQSLGQIAERHDSDQACKDLCQSLAELCMATERSIYAVQESNTESAGAQIRQFLPKDFRGSMMEMKRNATEKYYAKQVNDLVKKGGTIRQRYDLYLQQQWERRVSLAQMGELSGMFKFLVKNLGGIPQVLLDFAKEINAKVGPMEEQRLKYGPDLYLATTMGIKLDVVCALIVENAEGLDASKVASALSVIKPACEFYTVHTRRVIEFLGDLFAKSPFFVSANKKHAAAVAAANGVVTPASTLNGTDVRKRGSLEKGSDIQHHVKPTSSRVLKHSHDGCERHSFLSDTFLSCVDHHSWTERIQGEHSYGLLAGHTPEALPSAHPPEALPSAQDTCNVQASKLEPLNVVVTGAGTAQSVPEEVALNRSPGPPEALPKPRGGLFRCFASRG